MIRLLLAVCLTAPAMSAAEVAPAPRRLPDPPPAKMPFTGLTPAKLFPDLCQYHYGVSTTSDLCQKYCDQALGFYYSYVWIEAARSFETALQHDPDCAFAWLGLYRGLEKWGGGSKVPSANGLLAVVGGGVQPKLPDQLTKSPRDFALLRAKELMPQASHREQLLVTAKLQEKGMWPNVKPDERKKKAATTLDELLTLHDDDEEGWFARAQVTDGSYSQAVFYKSLLKVNPLHPGANHEFVHMFENLQRPALGWPYAEKYMESSPGLPHAFHMQAHLAMRIGKWKFTSDWSTRAVAMQKKYHDYQGVTPREDHQFQHHMETLTRSLVHDGRFAETRAVKADAEKYKYAFKPEWFRMSVAQKNWAETDKAVAAMRKTDKAGAAYHAALVALERGDTKRAAAEVDILRGVGGKRSTENEQRLQEVQGRLLCQQGKGDEGCKLFRRIVDKTKNSFGAHAWGSGAYYMEIWGVAALESGIASEAEEAFQEALAHDAGSVRGALGLWALCDRLGRLDEASRYLKVALRCWAKADPKDFANLKSDMARRAEKVRVPGSATEPADLDEGK